MAKIQTIQRIVLKDADDDRELASVNVPTESVSGVLELVNKAIGWGHEMSYVEAEDVKAGM